MGKDESDVLLAKMSKDRKGKKQTQEHIEKRVKSYLENKEKRKLELLIMEIE